MAGGGVETLADTAHLRSSRWAALRNAAGTERLPAPAQRRHHLPARQSARRPCFSVVRNGATLPVHDYTTSTHIGGTMIADVRDIESEL